jgi:hypothetical protein
MRSVNCLVQCFRVLVSKKQHIELNFPRPPLTTWIMSKQFDFEEYAARCRERIAKQFRRPDVHEFQVKYGQTVPEPLLNLYDLGELLMQTPLDIAVNKEHIYVQRFLPLVKASIDYGARYNWQFYSFACGGDSEAFLFSMAGEHLIYVDHDSDGTDIEATETDFTRLVEGVNLLLNENEHEGETGVKAISFDDHSGWHQ